MSVKSGKWPIHKFETENDSALCGADGDANLDFHNVNSDAEIYESSTRDPLDHYNLPVFPALRRFL